MNVPGPDGKFGFGGSCFPKDIQAMINFAEKLDINPATLKGVWETNLIVRPEQDWKKLKGRAVVDNEEKISLNPIDIEDEFYDQLNLFDDSVTKDRKRWAG